jgi:hypothetical protein
MKSNRALQVGISLFHIFEDEWHDLQKREIIKSMICIKLNHATKIYARKLVLREGHSSTIAAFLTENHLDGNVPFLKAFWLENDKGTIVCALTLRKHDQQTKWGSKTIELARVATIRNTVVVGGMSRLIKSAKLWAKKQDLHYNI